MLTKEDIVNIIIAIDNWIEDFSEDAKTCEYFEKRINEYESLRNKLLKM